MCDVDTSAVCNCNRSPRPTLIARPGVSNSQLDVPVNPPQNNLPQTYGGWIFRHQRGSEASSETDRIGTGDQPSSFSRWTCRRRRPTPTPVISSTTTFLIVLIEFEAPLDDKSRLYSSSNHHVHSPSKSKQLLSQHARRKKEQANLGVPTYNFGAPTQLLSVGSFNSFTLISHNHFYSVYFFSSLGVF